MTGPYVRRIFLEELGASPDSAVNIVPLEDFGGMIKILMLVHMLSSHSILSPEVLM